MNLGMWGQHPNSKANLRPIPLTQRSPEEQFAIRSMGGKKKSEAVKWKLRLINLKHKGVSPDTIKRLESWMLEPDAAVIDILIWLEQAKPLCKTPKDYALIAHALTKLLKAHHGEKIRTESVHHVVNWNEIFSECKIIESDIIDLIQYKENEEMEDLKNGIEP